MEENGDKKKGSNLRWWILLTVIIGTFLGRLDQTIVNLALPKIIGDFGIKSAPRGGLPLLIFWLTLFLCRFGENWETQSVEKRFIF
jgi:hypothetical protein